MVWFSFIDVSSKNWLYHGTNYQVDEENITFYLDHTMSKNLGSNQEKVHGSTNSSTSNWQMEFHMHMDASLLAIGAMLA
jgi:hypothetical protein